jgi:Ca-activated chloride channel homolog
MTTAKLLLLLQPRRAAVLADVDSTFDVLVRVQAPDRPSGMMTPRSRLHVALVIDRSGSMSGRPLAEARRCAEFVINGLLPTDSASVVDYDTHVRTVVPFSDLANKARFEAAIQGIESGGSTDLHGGWFAGAESLAPHTAADIVSRVILLSDGCANHGLVDQDSIWGQCGELAAAGVTTSTYGLGKNFNEHLMIGMARAGGGNSYYGETAEDLMDPFREELALLTALCARGLVLELQMPDGVHAEVLNGYRGDQESGWRLPDLAFGGEAWALVRLTVPRALAISGRLLDLLTVRVRHLDSGGVQQPALEGLLSVPVVSASVLGVLAEDELTVRRAKELDAAVLEDRARRAARARDWTAVDRLVAQVGDLADANPWLHGMWQSLKALAVRRDEDLFAKEAAFNANRKRTRLAGKEEAPGTADAEVADYLRRKMSQGKGDRR